MTNHPVAPVVTDEMVEVGLHKWFESEGDEIAELKADADIWEIYQRDMRAAITAAIEASGELERLLAALQKLHEGLAWDWRGHPVGDLPTLREIARTALHGDAP